MNDRQREFSNMLGAVQLVCDKYAAVWSGNAFFAAAYAAGVVDMQPALTDALILQKEKSSGATQVKLKNRKALEEATAAIASRLGVYALVSGLAELQLDAKLPKWRIATATDDALVGMANRVATLATKHLAALGAYGVTAGMVSALSAQAQAYTEQIGQALRLRQSAKEGTQTLAALIRQAREKLALMDACMILWKESEPDFYSEYRTCRALRAPGHRKRALQLEVKDPAGLPLQGVQLHLPAERLMRKTSARGICHVQHLPEGQHKARLSAVGYVPVELDIKIYPKTTRKLQVVMEKAG